MDPFTLGQLWKITITHSNDVDTLIEPVNRKIRTVIWVTIGVKQSISFEVSLWNRYNT
ncbi:hypothetical protein [Haloarcula amylolytica]|uniref:hypothetical protein n=1 Tax=Haloarcula amylolytica TaxID=396317 RepID=UPI003C788350